MNESALVDDHASRPTVVSPFFKGMSSVGFIESKVQKGPWKGIDVRIFVEIARLAHCQTCMRMTPYRFSMLTGYLSWRQCAKCLTKQEREAVRQLFGKSEREIVSNMQDYTVRLTAGKD